MQEMRTQIHNIYIFARCSFKLRYHNFVSIGIYNYIPHEIMYMIYEKMIYVYCLIIGFNFNAEYKQLFIFDRQFTSNYTSNEVNER